MAMGHYLLHRKLTSTTMFDSIGFPSRNAGSNFHD